MIHLPQVIQSGLVICSRSQIWRLWLQPVPYRMGSNYAVHLRDVILLPRELPKSLWQELRQSLSSWRTRALWGYCWMWARRGATESEVYTEMLWEICLLQAHFQDFVPVWISKEAPAFPNKKYKIYKYSTSKHGNYMKIPHLYEPFFFTGFIYKGKNISWQTYTTVHDHMITKSEIKLHKSADWEK